MQPTQRLRPVQVALPTRPAIPIVIAVALAIMLAVDLALVLKPGVAGSAAALLRELVVQQGTHALFAAFLRAGLAFGGVALGIAVLAAFIRGVQLSPYVWLAPVLVGFSGVVMAKSPVVLPMPLSTAGFAAVSGVLMLGGGALLQPRGVASKVAGALLLAVPTLLLLASYAPSVGGYAALPTLGDAARMFIFVVTMTSIGVGVVALAALSPGLSTERELSRARRVHEQELAAAHVRLRDSEHRALAAQRHAAHAEQALRLQGAELEAALASQEELEGFRKAARPAYAKLVLPLSAAALVAAALAGGYYAAYRPLAATAAAATARLRQVEHGHAAQLASAKLLAARAQTERDAQKAQLAAAQSRAAQLAIALEHAQGELASYRTSAAVSPAAVVAPKATKPKRHAPRRIAKREKPKAEPEARAAVAAPEKPKHEGPGVSASDDPLLGL